MAPRIYCRNQKISILLKSISLDSVPRGVLPAWRFAYHSAAPPVQREFLCLHEAVWSFWERQSVHTTITSFSRSKHLPDRVNKGERIRCIDPECSSKIVAASSYKCRNCHLDNIEALTKRIAEKESNQGTRNPRSLTGEWKIPKDKYQK